MSQLKNPSNEILLDLIIQHPRYSHFKRFGTDDYRDPDNDHLSLSSKGFHDFKSGESGSLTTFAKKEDLRELMEEARKIDGLNDNSFPKNSDTKSNPEKNKEAAIKLWK